MRVDEVLILLCLSFHQKSSFICMILHEIGQQVPLWFLKTDSDASVKAFSIWSQLFQRLYTCETMVCLDVTMPFFHHVQGTVPRMEVFTHI